MKKQQKRFAIACLLASTGLPALAQAAPDFQMPFPCGHTWDGNTRTNHNPQMSVDFNRYPDDYGDAVVASAGGTVSRVYNLGSVSYGRYVMIDHGNGWSTLYAHLSAASVRPGQRVSQGQRIGSLGNSGGSSGAHLHFEQRLNGYAQRIVFNGRRINYWGTYQYTSRNSCGGSGGGSASGTIKTTGMPLNVRSGPGTGYTVVDSVANGTRVSIECQVQGASVTGPYGTSRLWDRIGPGRFVSDAYVYTGSDRRVAPNCN